MKKFLILALSLLLLIVGIAGCSNITEVFGNPGISEKKTIFRQYNEDM